MHIANLLMSMLSSGQLSIKVNPATIEARGLAVVVARMAGAEGKYQPNPCSFYLLNLAIDVSVSTSTPEELGTNADGFGHRQLLESPS